MGLTSLESLEEFIGTNRRNYKLYQAGLGGVAEVQLMSFDEDEKSNYQYVVLELDEDLAGIKRDELVRVLHGENVIARRYFYPGCHQMEPYRSNYPDTGQRLPLTERLVERVITLPTGTAVEPRQISEICELLKWVISHGPEVHESLSRLPA